MEKEIKKYATIPCKKIFNGTTRIFLVTGY